LAGAAPAIVRRPEDAVLSAGMRALLGDLARHVTVAIVSGRDLEDVRRLAPLVGVRVERKRFAVAVHYREAAVGDVARVEPAVDAALRDRPELRKKGGKKIFELQLRDPAELERFARELAARLAPDPSWPPS
jgi:trehalose 6-phosphate phosphatase